MCQKCVDALNKYYPDVPDDQVGTFLMCTTCFPAGDADTIARQLQEMYEATDGSIGAAYEYADKIVEESMRSLRRDEHEGSDT